MEEDRSRWPHVFQRRWASQVRPHQPRPSRTPTARQEAHDEAGDKRNARQPASEIGAFQNAQHSTQGSPPGQTLAPPIQLNLNSEIHPKETCFRTQARVVAIPSSSDTLPASINPTHCASPAGLSSRQHRRPRNTRTRFQTRATRQHRPITSDKTTGRTFWRRSVGTS